MIYSTLVHDVKDEKDALNKLTLPKNWRIVGEAKVEIQPHLYDGGLDAFITVEIKHA